MRKTQSGIWLTMWDSGSFRSNSISDLCFSLLFKKGYFQCLMVIPQSSYESNNMEITHNIYLMRCLLRGAACHAHSLEAAPTEFEECLSGQNSSNPGPFATALEVMRKTQSGIWQTMWDSGSFRSNSVSDLSSSLLFKKGYFQCLMVIPLAVMTIKLWKQQYGNNTEGHK